MTIDLSGGSLEWLVAFITICGGLYALGYFIYRQCKKIHVRNAMILKHEEAICFSKKERKLIIELLQTVLEVTAQGKNNGNVERSMKKIDEFMNEEIHE